MKDPVVVIGAGIVGLLTAYRLVENGYKVIVVDKERYSAQKCSYANGGQSSVSNSEVWTTYDNIKRGMKWIFKKDAPLYISPSLSIDKIKWLSKFIYNTYKKVYKNNTIQTILMGLESQEYYNRMINNNPLFFSFDQQTNGILHVYKDIKYFRNAQSVKSLFEDNGCEWSILDDMGVLDIEPNISHKGIVGGIYTRTDWTGDAWKFCIQLQSVLEQIGVEFQFSNESISLDNTSLKTIICAGVGSEKLARSIGETLNIYPVKGYSITINNVDPKLLPRTSILDDEAKIVTSSIGNRLRVAGTAEFSGENYDITRSRIEPLLKWVQNNFPKIDCSSYSQWACLRPMTPNMMPVIKRSSKKNNIFYNTGHGHLGWTLAPATAGKVLELIGE